jgi:hypothetical protein
MTTSWSHQKLTVSLHFSVRNDFIEGTVLQMPNTVFVLGTKLPNEIFLESEHDVNFTSMLIILVSSHTECNINVLKG